MIAFPPSPALSECDSLAGVDLDAFLDAQGSLSHFPTPPLKETAVVEITEVSDADDDLTDADHDVSCTCCDSNCACCTSLTSTDEHLAQLFLAEASRGLSSTLSATTSIRNMLWRAQLPPEILALAFNILAQHSRSFASNHTSKPSDLLSVCAMTLAVSLTNDHPPSSAYWSHRICDSAWTARDIDQSTLGMLLDLEWRLHELSSPRAIERTMAKLFIRPGGINPNPEPKLDMLLTRMQGEVPQSLVVTMSDSAACWAEGQLTPDASPPCSAVEKPSRNLWLRLL